MATQVQLRRGTATENDAFTGAQGELTFDTTNKRVRIHDGATAGGFELKTENSSGDTLFADGEKAIFGAGSDLQIYHDGTSNHSIINEIGTGNLKLQGTNVVIEASNGTATQAEFFAGDANRFYYNNALKLATTSTGIDVTGTVTADGLTVNSSDPNLTFTDSDTGEIAKIKTSNAGHLILDASEQNASGSGNVYVRTQNNTLRALYNYNGDISFYEDTGTTAKFFWDASAESLGIGTSSPSHLIDGRLSGTSSGEVISVGNVTTGSFGGIAISDGGTYPVRHWGSSLEFYTGNSTYSSATERMRIDSSGNVGIGVTPSSHATNWVGLELNNAGSGIVVNSSNNTIVSNNGYYNGTNWVYGGTGYATNYRSESGTHKWNYAASGTAGNTITWSEAMRIDSSGNLLVGKTSASGSTVGAEMRSAGTVIATVANDYPLYLNRTSSDGDIAKFVKDGTTVGSIGSVASGANLYMSAASGVGLGIGGDNLYPVNASGASTDGSLDIGDSTARFKDLYLSGGVYLGGTGSANKLDDYEEGLHVVTMTASGGGTVSMQSGSDTMAYTKIGRQVTVTGDVRISSVSGVSGNTQISIPFSVGNFTDLAERGGMLVNVWNGSSWTIQRAFTADNDSKITVQVLPAAGYEYRLTYTYFTN